MGILAQTIAGGIAGAANTGADLMKDQIKTERAAAIQTERDKAQAIKEQSLAEFRLNKEHSLKGSGMVDSYGAEFTNEEFANHQYNPETEEAPISKKEYDRLQEVDKNTLIDGNETTIGKAQEAIQANKVTSLIDSARQKAAKEFMESDEAKNMSPEERGKKMSAILGQDEDARKSWEGSTGKVDRIKDIEARQKKEQHDLDRAQKAELAEAALEEKKTASKRHDETLRAISGDRLAAAGEKGKEKNLTANEASANVRQLNKVVRDGGELTESEKDLLQKSEQRLAMDKKPDTTPEANDFIFGGQPAAPATPAKTAQPAGRPATGPKPITATNPTTKQKAISYDGGKTWQTPKK